MSLTKYSPEAYILGVRKKEFTVEDVIAMMKKKQGDSSLRSFAGSLGVTPAFVCDIYKGRRLPGEMIAKHFGLQVVRETRTHFVLDKAS